MQTKTSSKGGVLEDVYTKFYLEDTYPLNKWPSMAGLHTQTTRGGQTRASAPYHTERAEYRAKPYAPVLA